MQWCHFHKGQKKKHKVPRTVAKDLVYTCIHFSDLVFHKKEQRFCSSTDETHMHCIGFIMFVSPC